MACPHPGCWQVRRASALGRSWVSWSDISAPSGWSWARLRPLARARGRSAGPRSGGRSLLAAERERRVSSRERADVLAHVLHAALAVLGRLAVAAGAARG